MLIVGAQIIDGVAERPLEGQAIWIEGRRLRAIAPRETLNTPPDVEVLDARGAYVIPGLMNANVHLLMDIRLEVISRYEEQYEELIIEAAQVALKNGLTTVFDTWGPRRPLKAARDRIDAGETPGSRIFCAGNVVGWDGPFSADFMVKTTEMASTALVERVNALWVENIGRHLMWLAPAEVAREVRAYLKGGVDFLKYTSNEHFGGSAGALLAFSQQVQEAIVEETHAHGLKAHAHTMSIEGLRIAVEAGADIIQHANHTGPVKIPNSTLDLMARRGVGVTVFPMKQARLDWLMKGESYRAPVMWKAADDNARNLIKSGARLLLANDGSVLAPETLADPHFANNWGGPWEDNLFNLATGHFAWLEAMEEKGCAPMEILRAATRNIALVSGKDRELGTLEPGKRADLLILEKNPLESARHYRGIRTIIKDGVVVNRDALPSKPLLSRTLPPPPPEKASFVPFLGGGKSGFPICPCAVDR